MNSMSSYLPIQNYEPEFVDYYDSPIGLLKINASDSEVVSCKFHYRLMDSRKPNALTKETILQLMEYFKGNIKNFDLPLKFDSGKFQARVFETASDIPYGSTLSYQDVALKLGEIKYTRAVAGAVINNSHHVIIPCHRVVLSPDMKFKIDDQNDRKKMFLLEYEQGLLSKM